MAVLEWSGDPNDGSTGSGGNSYDDGEDFQFKIQEGLQVFLAGDDPQVGETLLVGAYMTSQRVEVEDDDGNGTHKITVYIQRIYEMWQVFPGMDQAVPATEDLVSIALMMVRASYAYTSTNYATQDTMITWIRDNTLPPTTGWANLYQLWLANQVDIRHEKLMMDRSPSGQVFNFYEAGAERFMINYKLKLASGKKDIGLLTVMESEQVDYPLTAKTWSIYFIASSGTTADDYKPKLRLHTVKKHVLNHVIGASCQMTDGTALMFNYNPTLNRYEFRYQNIDQTSSTLVLSGNIGDAYTLFGAIAGNQTVSICRDDSNNVYVAAATGSTTQGDIKYFIIAAFKYNGGRSWTGVAAGTGVEGNNNSFGAANDQDGKVNNVSICWVPTTQGDVGGTVCVLTSRRAGHWALRQQNITTVNARYLLGVAGVAANEQTASHDPLSQPAGNWRPFNVSGSGMDMWPCGAARDKLAIGTYYPMEAAAPLPRHATITSKLSTVGVPAKPIRAQLGGDSKRYQVNDPDGKTRTPWMNSTQRYAVINSGVMEIRNVVDDALFRILDFTTFNITNFPSLDTLSGSSAWDIIWDASRACFWIYYIDSQNPRLLRKVSYDPESNTLDPSLQFTPSNLGPSGSRILAIRAPRGVIDNRCVLIDVAMIDGALQPLDMIILRDLSMNHVPNGPTLPSITSFNATSSKDIPWFFTDADPNDIATKQDIEIRRVSNGSVVHNPTNVTATLVSGNQYKYTIPGGTLSNDTQYQIRIRAYDAVGGQGVWSNYEAFTTSGTGGQVTILTPQDGITINVSSIGVSWSYSNTNPAITQVGYQIKRYNNATNALLYDSGVVTSTATSVNLTGLVSGVEHRIEVSVKGSDNNLSGSGIVTVITDYNNPSVPVISLLPTAGTIDVRITNPPPTGENPVTVVNQVRRKETGADDSTYIIIGTAPVNGAYSDQSVASGKDYTYQVRGQAANGATGPWSAPANTIARLTGMWISFPSDPNYGTIQLPLGGVGRQESAGIQKTDIQYVGREYPISEFGTAKVQAITVTTQVLGPGDADDTEERIAAIRRLADGPYVVLYRDSRGRKMYATIGNFSMLDVEQGSYDATLTFNRVDYDESIA